MCSVNEFATYEKRIREIAPEVAITSLSLNREGLLNDVVIVNDELIFRFPKHEYGFKHLRDEAKILRLLRNYITLEIPSPIYERDSAELNYDTLRTKSRLQRRVEDGNELT